MNALADIANRQTRMPIPNIVSGSIPDCEVASAIVIEGLSKKFGGVYAVQNVSLNCKVGEVVGLIGPNGAGKTTLMNLISGVLTPDSGTVHLSGKELKGGAPELCARAGIARTFQNIRLFKRLTVRENIEVAQITSKREKSGRKVNDIDEILDLLDL